MTKEACMQHRQDGPIVPPQDSEALIWMGELALLKVTGEMSNGLYSVVEVFATPEGLVPLHVHHREDEALYVLDGELSVRIGDAMHEARQGSLVFGPKGVPHKYWVNSPSARLLMIFSPAGFEGFIRKTSEPATSLAPPPISEAVIDFDKILAAAAEYGAEVRE